MSEWSRIQDLNFLNRNFSLWGIMDKDHLIELISNSLFYESKNSDSTNTFIDFKNYLERLNLDQLRTMSKEFIL